MPKARAGSGCSREMRRGRKGKAPAKRGFMGKALYIAEKPSVAQEFAKALKLNTSRRDGYLEGEDSIVTWCVGHLVTMSYPEVYDEKYKKWSERS